MLTRQDKAIIRYCFSNGISARDLAQKYNRTAMRIYQIQWQPESEIFPSEDARSWFLAGIEAGNSLRQPQDDLQKPTNPLLQARQERCKLRQKLYCTRTKNLPIFRQQEPDVALDEQNAIEDDDVDAEQRGDTQAVARVIIEDMLHNLSARRRRYDPAVIKFGYILRSYSAACYDYMRKVLPLPSRQVITARFKGVERRLTRSYELPGDLDYVMASYFDRHPLQDIAERLDAGRLKKISDLSTQSSSTVLKIGHLSQVVLVETVPDHNVRSDGTAFLTRKYQNVTGLARKRKNSYRKI